MSAILDESARTATLTFSKEDFEKLRACAKYQNMGLAEVVRYYLQDWIGTDYPASQGRVSRRQIYRDVP